MGIHGAVLNGEVTWSAFIKSSLGLFHEAQVIVVQSWSWVWLSDPRDCSTRGLHRLKGSQRSSREMDAERIPSCWDEMWMRWDEMRWRSLDQRGAKLTDSKKKSLGGERAGTLWLDGAVGEWRGGFNVSPSDPGHREWFTIPKTGFEGQGRGRHLVTVWAPEWLSRL